MKMGSYRKFGPVLWQSLTERLLFPIQDIPISAELSLQLTAVFEDTENIESFFQKQAMGLPSPPVYGGAVPTLCATVISTYQALAWITHAGLASAVTVDAIVRFEASELPLAFLDVDSAAIFGWWMASTLLFAAFTKHFFITRDSASFNKTSLFDYFSLCKVAVILLSGSYLAPLPSPPPVAGQPDLQATAYGQYRRMVQTLLRAEEQPGALLPSATPKDQRHWFLDDFVYPLHAAEPSLTAVLLSLIDIVEPSAVAMLFDAEVADIRGALISISPLVNCDQLLISDLQLRSLFKPRHRPEGPLFFRKCHKLEQVLSDLSAIVHLEPSPLLTQHRRRLLQILHCYHSRALLDLDDIPALTPPTLEICTAHSHLLTTDIHTLTALLHPEGPVSLHASAILSSMIVHLRFTLHALWVLLTKR